MFAKIQRIHFVGIGGIGMSGIAEVLLNLGYKISGSDLKSSAITQRLATLGATIFEDHRAENIAGAEVVVASSAISRAALGCDSLRAASPILRRRPGSLSSELTVSTSHTMSSLVSSSKMAAPARSNAWALTR